MEVENVNRTTAINVDRPEFDVSKLIFAASTTITIESAFALIINLFLLICSCYLRKPIGTNLRLCVNLTAANAGCAFFYMISNLINVIIPTISGAQQVVSHCISLIVECLKISTFFASLFILLALALNHYTGILHPLYRYSLSKSTFTLLLVTIYLVPTLFFITLFSIMPGGFRNEQAFGFFTLKGCVGANIMTKFSVRLVTVVPFIIFVAVIVSLYAHIIIHMRQVTKNSTLLQFSTNARSQNRRLHTTIALFAGSCVLGWLPTLLSHIVFCKQCIAPLTKLPLLSLLIMCQFIHVLKLIVDGFIYASRLTEIRFSRWIFQRKLLMFFTGKKQLDVIVPNEYLKYISETNDANPAHLTLTSICRGANTKLRLSTRHRASIYRN